MARMLYASIGEVGCILVYAIRDVSFMASTMTLALLGIERYAVIKLLLYNNITQKDITKLDRCLE